MGWYIDAGAGALDGLYRAAGLESLSWNGGAFGLYAGWSNGLLCDQGLSYW